MAVQELDLFYYRVLINNAINGSIYFKMENRIKSPQISIVLYIYESKLNIQAIWFILTQSVTDFELIVVSNNSKKIRDALSMLNDNRIYHIIVQNKKQAFAYEGIKNARGEYICFASSNTAYQSDWLKRQIAFMEKSDTIGISGVCLTSYISDIELIKVLHLKGPIFHWSSIIIRRCILYEYESLFNEQAHISVICYQLAVFVLRDKEKSFSVFTDKIFLYNMESNIGAKGFDQVRLEQIKAMGIRTNKKAKLHSELFSFKKSNSPFQKYKNWIEIIEKHNNGYYDPDFLSGLFGSHLCSKNANLVSPKVSNQASDAIKILVICPFMEVINPFISILINEINSDKYFVKYGIQAFWNVADDYDIIHIHWPEMFFNWRIPTENDLENLSNSFEKWKQKGAKIVYTRHDEDSHYSLNKPMTQKMFDLVKKNAYAIVHLGEYSKRETTKELNIPEQINVVIPHYVFDTIYSNNVNK
jgi:hypothetical protein